MHRRRNLLHAINKSTRKVMTLGSERVPWYKGRRRETEKLPKFRWHVEYVVLIRRSVYVASDYYLIQGNTLSLPNVVTSQVDLLSARERL